MYNKSNNEIIKAKDQVGRGKNPESESRRRKFDFLNGIEYPRLDAYKLKSHKKTLRKVFFTRRNAGDKARFPQNSLL
jgi:hypothetical protein